MNNKDKRRTKGKKHSSPESAKKPTITPGETRNYIVNPAGFKKSIWKAMQKKKG